MTYECVSESLRWTRAAIQIELGSAGSCASEGFMNTCCDTCEQTLINVVKKCRYQYCHLRSYSKLLARWTRFDERREVETSDRLHYERPELTGYLSSSVEPIDEGKFMLLLNPKKLALTHTGILHAPACYINLQATQTHHDRTSLGRRRFRRKSTAP
jgi:hypothetical protein